VQIRTKSWRIVATGAIALTTLSMGLMTSLSGASPVASHVSVKTGGTVTMALDETLAGLNINTSGANLFVLQEIMNLVWPQVYITQGSLKEVLNTDFVTNVAVASSPVQTITYTINPKAVWADGTPINADDFIYNYQTLSGNAQWTDVGGAAYQPAGTSGFNQISSVTGSNPPNGAACDPGTVANRNVGLCPNGDTVTVKFSKPFADWQGMFSDLVPAHVARSVGWNTGFVDGTQAISGSWYSIQSVSTSSVVLVRNTKYWGTPGKLDSIVFQQFGDDTQEVPALANGEVQVINPITVSLAIVQAAKQVTGINRNTTPGLEFEHFDFNQANTYLKKLAVRQALAYGTNRKQIISHTVGEIAPTVTPLNNHMFMNTQPQYVNNGAQYTNVQVKKAKKLLSGLGFKMGKDGYFHPNYGPEKGKDLSFHISTTTGNPTRAATEQLFQANMKSIGVKIVIQNYAAADFFGTIVPKGQYDIAEFAWVGSPFVTGNEPLYCSYTNANCGENWIHFANKGVDSLVFAGAAATSPAVEAKDYNAADKILWSQMATLPLYQKPIFTAWSSTIGNIIPNASSSGITWNGNAWGAL
jgi:peptide/nickel transport system substrate-binding protein